MAEGRRGAVELWGNPTETEAGALARARFCVHVCWGNLGPVAGVWRFASLGRVLHFQDSIFGTWSRWLVPTSCALGSMAVYLCFCLAEHQEFSVSVGTSLLQENGLALKTDVPSRVVSNGKNVHPVENAAFERGKVVCIII
jgi:hypothetical protein